ncbi:hypothetical protein QJS10_CPA10g01056 [Acorus calamus]|uniref:Uncharacterized protein n=1 Tax=Acorus calamus TaxID=4465 RepID=A0AAV9E288_ACOCL|nr:hypothetical protein QJS10_CPA10g01056 [Acorus calamus]
MATASPMLCNNSNETGSTLPVNNGSLTPQRSILIDTPRQNLRGLNKPKCIKCGNVARSRQDTILNLSSLCPAINGQTSCGIFIEDCFISTTFQYIFSISWSSSVITRKKAIILEGHPDAIAVNGWRFSKLKGYTEGNLKAETEAFERYMQNVSLLDEVFSSNLFLDGLMRDGLPAAGDSSYNEEDENIKAILTMKARLKSSAERIDSYRGMIKGMVSQGLNRMKVESCDEGDSLYNDDVDDCVDLKRPKKVDKLGATRTMAVDDLIDKLNKARREDDLKSYLEMKLQLFDSNVHGKASCYLSEAVQLSCRENCVEVTTSREISDIEAVSSCHSLPKLWNSIEVDQACLANIDMQFSSLDEVANL